MAAKVKAEVFSCPVGHDTKAEVDYDGHTYSLDTIPGVDTPLVIREQERLWGIINSEALINDLGQLGNCIGIVYHGVTGIDELKIEIDLHQFCYDVIKLCDKSAVAVKNFKNVSTASLSSLKAIYGFLMNSFEELAIATLAHVNDEVMQMGNIAEELRKEFDNQVEKLMTVLEKTVNCETLEEFKRKRQEIEAEKEKQEKLQKEAAEAQQKAEQLAQDADAKENEAIRTIMDLKEDEHARDENTGLCKKLVNAFTGHSSRQTAALNASLRTNEEKAKAAREERIKHLMEVQQKQEMCSKALAELAEYAKQIQNMEADKSNMKTVIYALHNSIQALKSLSAVMIQAALFWYQLQEHCEHLAKGEMKEMIEKALKYDEDRRLKFWNSKGFKSKAIQYYAGWVALDHVCGIYMERIMLTQRELYTYIQEALRPEEAREKVKELCTKFVKDLESKQKAMADKKEEQLKEMEELLKAEQEAKKQGSGFL